MENQQQIIDTFKGGGTCPFCQRYGKIYERRISKGMASALCYLYYITVDKEPLNGWINVSEHFANMHESQSASEFSKLKFWGLIEPHVAGSKGLWRITDTGKKFVCKEIKIAGSVFVFENNVVGNGLSEIDINDVLIENFDIKKHINCGV